MALKPSYYLTTCWRQRASCRKRTPLLSPRQKPPPFHTSLSAVTEKRPANGMSLPPPPPYQPKTYSHSWKMPRNPSMGLHLRFQQKIPSRWWQIYITTTSSFWIPTKSPLGHLLIIFPPHALRWWQRIVLAPTPARIRWQDRVTSLLCQLRIPSR